MSPSGWSISHLHRYHHKHRPESPTGIVTFNDFINTPVTTLWRRFLWTLRRNGDYQPHRRQYFCIIYHRHAAGSNSLMEMRPWSKKVHAIASTTTVSSSPNPSSAGQPVTFTATVDQPPGQLFLPGW
jgi:hypothetical protein